MSKRVLLYVTGGDASPAEPNGPTQLVRFNQVVTIEGGVWDEAANQFIPGHDLHGVQVRILCIVVGGNVNPSPENPQGCTGEAVSGGDHGPFGDQGPWVCFPSPWETTLAEGAPVTMRGGAESFGADTTMLIIEA